MSKIFRRLMTIVVATTTIVGMIIGMVTRRKIASSLAPSTRAASRMSAGMLLSAAERITMQNPVQIHTYTRINAILFPGELMSHACGGMPNRVMMALSSPLCVCHLAAKSYMRFQMTPAPTNEMAIGMKIAAFAMLSMRTRSTSTAMISPKNTVAAVPSTSHNRLFRSTSSMLESVKIVRKFFSPTKLVESLLKKLNQMVLSTGHTRKTATNTMAGPIQIHAAYLSR